MALYTLHFTEVGTEKIALALHESLEATILWGFQSSFSWDNWQLLNNREVTWLMK